MSIHSMMYNGLSGVNSMSGNMGMLADNIANLNTVGHKSSYSVFQNVLTSASSRYSDIGNGSQVAAIYKNFQTGQLEGSGRATDMAIDGRGFFMLRDPRESGEYLYTRDGQFLVSEQTGAPPGTYFLVTPQGRYAQGYNLGSVATPSDTVEDILIRRESLPQATSEIKLALNLQYDPGKVEAAATESQLYAAWNGAQQPPLAESAYDYRTILQCYDDQGQAFDLSVYFDYTSQANEREFIVTQDPTLDRRLLNDGSRYNDGATPETGAGALLYGKLLFNSGGELLDIQAWQVPADGSLIPSAANMLARDQSSGLYSFEYNLSGAGPNLNSAIDFGSTTSPQVATSPGTAKATAAGPTAPAISPLTMWNNVYDVSGNKVQDGDEITFSGLNRDGEDVTLAYVVDYQNRVEDLMNELEDAFACTVLLNSGRLELHDQESGASQLAVTAISYRDADGNGPADNPLLAQFFGDEGSAFTVTAADNQGLSPIRTTNYATGSVDIFKGQDGFGIGILKDISVAPDGVVTGHYSNNQSLAQAQVALADFASYKGLTLFGGNIYKATEAAGTAVIGAAGSGSFGNIHGNSLEVSNVDLARQFVDLTLTQRIFQANSMSISTANEVYETALRLKT